MKQTDHILILTRALLTASKNDFQRIHSLIGEMYTINENRKPHAVSLGAQGFYKEETFYNWAARLHQQGVKSLTFFYHTYENEAMPSHQAAAFAGFQDLLLRVTTSTDTSTYTLATFRSYEYEITPEQLIVLMDSQEIKEDVWLRSTQLIVDSNKLNSKTIMTASETRAYMVTPEGRDVVGYMVNNLVQEIQIECLLHNAPFIIPEAMQSLFTRSQNAQLIKADEREYVYLYPTQEVSATQILTLIEVQSLPFFWERLNQKIAQDSYTSLKVVTLDLWPTAIQAMKLSEIQDFAYYACGIICEICKENKLKPIIPKSMAAHFGPSEEDQKRAVARSQSESTRWALQVTKNPWQHYAFCELAYNEIVQADMFVNADQAFKDILVDIQLFAKNHQSSFEEAFRLAHFVLTQLPANAFDNEGHNTIKWQLQEAGFSERAITVFERKASITEFLKSLGSEDYYIRGILAVSIADVFGGMGSWNDQYFEHHQQTYETLSASLFNAMRRYFVSLLSWTNV